MNHREPRQPQDMEELLQQAVRQILQQRDLDAFLDWMREAIPSATDGEQLSDDDERRLAMLLGLAIWNALPRPDNAFLPMAVPRPAVDADCLCGSGRRFDACCGNDAEDREPAPELPAELLWELLLQELSDLDLQRALRLRVVPESLFAQIADHWLAIDRPGRATALLEPLFDGDLSALDERFELAMDALCDAYDALDHWKKKQTFLLRVTDAGGPSLKAAAWQRLSIMFIDEGEFDYAFEAFQQAQHHGPDSVLFWS